MKTLKNIFGAAPFILMFAAAFLQTGYAQDSTSDRNKEKEISIKDRVNGKDFVFVAQSVSPLRRGTRQLTSSYDVIVSADTVMSDLPYFGRAYSAPINPSEGGLSFTSTKFEYLIKELKKGGWSVSIKPKDQHDVQQLFFNIFENGKASLQVNSTYRDQISFDGYITGRKRN